MNKYYQNTYTLAKKCNYNTTYFFKKSLLSPHFKISLFTERQGEEKKKGQNTNQRRIPRSSFWHKKRTLAILGEYYIHSLLKDKIGSLGKMSCTQRLGNPI